MFDDPEVFAQGWDQAVQGPVSEVFASLPAEARRWLAALPREGAAQLSFYVAVGTQSGPITAERGGEGIPEDLAQYLQIGDCDGDPVGVSQAGMVYLFPHDAGFVPVHIASSVRLLCHLLRAVEDQQSSDDTDVPDEQGAGIDALVARMELIEAPLPAFWANHIEGERDRIDALQRERAAEKARHEAHLRATDAPARLREGSDALASGRPWDAIDVFGAFIAQADHAEAFLGRARAWIAVGEPQNASHDLDCALRLDPTLAPVIAKERRRI